MEKQALAPGIFTISDVLGADECRQLIARAERRGFHAATVDAIDGPRLDKDMRNNDRAIEDDFDLARRLWSRVRKFVPRTLGTRVRGLNERFRYYRYTPGQRFDWHFDGSFIRPNGELSRLTFMIYLNQEYQGGETRFESVSVVGKPGMALLFEHELLHQGAEVTSGIKYVLRSDVMYSGWKQI
ncbi:2OG-Fe(II) oxygenase [Steroidobacter sp. S1-65]|uniref:2OG-Fe(II) oxygenase n=1 Tax=Steroidobacter gossypii TaxID=2805490 RepID=A0ABS1WTT1_9GAMM|nr:2OG-Fe(II) oxygenase [Steroidobacter gossypii]MBM0104381.1 2OG-Fe(II) oxygenase [Steroidobacter gossypii]